MGFVVGVAVGFVVGLVSEFTLIGCDRRVDLFEDGLGYSVGDFHLLVVLYC